MSAPALADIYALWGKSQRDDLRRLHLRGLQIYPQAICQASWPSTLNQWTLKPDTSCPKLRIRCWHNPMIAVALKFDSTYKSLFVVPPPKTCRGCFIPELERPK